jgi:transposase-like protein
MHHSRLAAGQKPIGELPAAEQPQNKTSKLYPPEQRGRAVRPAMDPREKDQSEVAALTAIAGRSGWPADTLRTRIRQVQRSVGARSGPARPVSFPKDAVPALLQ